jgi:N-acetylneuraminic acid mutarotase
VSRPLGIGRRGVLVVLAVIVPLAVVAALLARGPFRSSTGQATLDAGCSPAPELTRRPDGAHVGPAWRRAPSYPILSDEIRAATVGKLVFVGSGLRFVGQTARSLDDLFSYDPSTGTYERVPNLPTRLDHVTLVGHDGALYVIGGFRGNTPVASVFRLDPRGRRWTTLSPMRVPRGSPAAAAIGDRIYVVGGSTGSRDEPRASAGLEILDLRTGRWTIGPDMPTARHHHGAASLRGQLYVVGGRTDEDDSSDAVERFDPETGRWSRLASLPLAVGGLGVASTGDVLVATGGGDDREHWVTPATWTLEPDGRWRRRADLVAARHGHATAAVGDTIVVFGGAPCPGYGRTAAVESLRVPPAPG